jgi:hypothetical protein
MPRQLPGQQRPMLQPPVPSRYKVPDRPRQKSEKPDTSLQDMIIKMAPMIASMAASSGAGAPTGDTGMGNMNVRGGPGPEQIPKGTPQIPPTPPPPPPPSPPVRGAPGQMAPPPPQAGPGQMAPPPPQGPPRMPSPPQQYMAPPAGQVRGAPGQMPVDRETEADKLKRMHTERMLRMQAGIDRKMQQRY